MLKLYEYARLMRMDKPIGIFLLLWPTLWALWLSAEGKPKQGFVIIFCLGVFFMRSAGCVINDIFDRKIDPLVTRTKLRPLVLGTVSVTEAIILFFILILASLFLVRYLSIETQLLAVPAVIVAASYPLMKRYHHFPQAYLGLAFGFGILMSYMAILGHLTFESFLVFFTNLIWVIIYDTQYAMVDREDDKQINVKSTAILFEKWLGKKDYLVVLTLQITMLMCLVLLGYMRKFGSIWLITLILVAVCFMFQIRAIKTHQPEQCFKAFLDNHKVGIIIFIGIVLSFLPV